VPLAARRPALGSDTYFRPLPSISDLPRREFPPPGRPTTTTSTGTDPRPRSLYLMSGSGDLCPRVSLTRAAAEYRPAGAAVCHSPRGDQRSIRTPTSHHPHPPLTCRARRSRRRVAAARAAASAPDDAARPKPLPYRERPQDPTVRDSPRFRTFPSFGNLPRPVTPSPVRLPGRRRPRTAPPPTSPRPGTIRRSRRLNGMSEPGDPCPRVSPSATYGCATRREATGARPGHPCRTPSRGPINRGRREQ
jgi:hypothetical protein